ncbi:hypothetical protein INR49_026920 [Caranx melampygus]|nr:hypothetical protein INR49_026920 [Caranx melampygus]
MLLQCTRSSHLSVLTITLSGTPASPEHRCHQVYQEVEIFRAEGEPVILSFPYLKRQLTSLNIAPSAAGYLFTKDNGTEGEATEGDGRVQQHNEQLWFLPALASDSGLYNCTYRNETFCLTGSIRLYVYKSKSANINNTYFPVRVFVGEDLKYKCPHLSYFNRTGREIEWYKNSSSSAVPLSRVSSSSPHSGKLIIPDVKTSHAGFYTCQLQVLINNQQYRVSRTIQLQVEEPQYPDPDYYYYYYYSTSVPDLSVTSDPEGVSSSNDNVHTPPIIISPLNGSTIESPHGSGVELLCTVLTECQMADSTVVTWLVNRQPVESSYLDGRALQGGRRVTKMSRDCHIEVRLVVVGVTEEDVHTELRCVTQNQAGRQEVVAHLQLEDTTFTWLVVAVVAISCFLTVVSIFIYVLFKPKRKNKMDYILARQNSTF